MNIEECKQISILDVANRLGIYFKQVSSSVYEHSEHDSFRIFSTTNTFKWFSRDIQGDGIDDDSSKVLGVALSKSSNPDFQTCT